jgi:hypothetical protein
MGSGSERAGSFTLHSRTPRFSIPVRPTKQGCCAPQASGGSLLAGIHHLKSNVLVRGGEFAWRVLFERLRRSTLQPTNGWPM